MKKTQIIIDTEDSTQNGNRIAITFKATDPNMYDKVEFQEFKNVLIRHIIANELFNVNNVLELNYSNNITVKDKLTSLNSDINTDIEIIDIKRVHFPVLEKGVPIQYNAFNEGNKASMLLYIETKSKKSYLEKQAFISHLLKHLNIYRPLCLNEKSLHDEIKKKVTGNDYVELLTKAVLEEQYLDDPRYKDPISKLLVEYGIDIVDFEWAA